MKTELLKFIDHTKDIEQLIDTIDPKAGYYKLGKNNKYYDYLGKMYKESSNHASMVDNIKNRIVGSNIKSDDPIEQAKIDERNVNQWFSLASQNYVMYGGNATEVIWNELHTYINRFDSLNLDRVRIGLQNDDEESTLFFYSQHFSNYKYNVKSMVVDVIYKFDTDERSDDHQLIYNYGVNRVGNDIYPRPDFSAGLPWINVDAALPLYYMNLVKNNFQVNSIIVVPANPSEDERELFEQGLKERFTGVENAGSTLVIYADPNSTNKVEVLPVVQDQSDKKYNELVDLAVESIARSHRFSSPMLAGISLPGNLFGISDLPSLERQFNIQTIYPKRQAILNDFELINSYFKDPIKDYYVDDMNLFEEKITEPTYGKEDK